MAMFRSDLPKEAIDLAMRFSQETFEEWAGRQVPVFPLGKITINGVFDRYFDPQTQAAWEGFRKSGALAVAHYIRQHIALTRRGL